jgi:hypothetical protein
VPVLEPASGESIIVDNNDPGFAVTSGKWGHCFSGDCGGIPWGQDFLYAEPECLTCQASFALRVEKAGDYDLWAWWPWGDDRATDTPFVVEYPGGSLTVEVDQHNSGDDWFWLANLGLAAGDELRVTVSGTKSGFANADAVCLTPQGVVPPKEDTAVVIPLAGARPSIQYFYVEASTEPGCYYLHWDISGATSVWLDGDPADNPGSAEVCPEETRDYALVGENTAGRVERILTVEARAEAVTEGSGPPASTPARIPTPPPVPATSGYRRIIFLHHSCGANLIEQGGVRARFAALGYEFYDHGYNGDGLVLADGTWTGENYDVPEDNTDPGGLATVFSRPLHSPPDNTFSHLMQYDVIMVKSCFPNSNIGSDEQLAEFKGYYLSMRGRMDQYPTKLFVIVTQPPQVPSSTDAAEARRARNLATWLGSDEFLGGHHNVVTFDFFGALIDPSTNMLRSEYTADPSDAHPNERANQTIAPMFVNFVDRAIRAYTAR